MLPTLRRLQAQLGDGLNQIRMRWLEGKIDAGLGRLDRAIEALSWVRTAFAKEDMPLRRSAGGHGAGRAVSQEGADGGGQAAGASRWRRCSRPRACTRRRRRRSPSSAGRSRWRRPPPSWPGGWRATCAARSTIQSFVLRRQRDGPKPGAGRSRIRNVRQGLSLGIDVRDPFPDHGPGAESSPTAKVPRRYQEVASPDEPPL